jgi:hypothetical protein
MRRHFTEVNGGSNPFPAVKAAPVTERRMHQQAVQQARDNFVGWVRWYFDTHRDEVPTLGALAKKLGITGGALTQLMAAGSRRAPQFKTLVGARRLTGVPIDALLFTAPPSRRGT